MHYAGDVFYLYPEYCSGPFYMGWHLYERDRNDGSLNDKGDWGWIRSSSFQIDNVKRLCDALGHADMPPVDRYNGRFVDEFARRFPNGILVRLAEYHQYEVIRMEDQMVSEHSALNSAAGGKVAAEMNVYYIPLEQIVPSPYQRRVEFARIEELAESIRVHGVLQPVTVRQFGGKYELIAGERRLRATTLAGLTEIPARVIEVDDREAAELVVTENLQREDLNAIETAESFKLLMKSGLTQSEIGGRLGMAQPTVANSLRLLELPEAVQERIRAGELTASHGRALLKWAEYPTLLDAVAGHVIKESMPVKELEKLDITDYRLSGPLDKSGAVYVLSHWVDAGGRGNLRMEWDVICKGCSQYLKSKASYANPLCLKPACAKEHVKGERAKQKAEESARLEAVREKHPGVQTFEEVTDKLKYNEWDWLGNNHICLKEHPDCDKRKAVARDDDDTGIVCLDPKCHDSYREQERKADELNRREKANVIRERIFPLFNRDSSDPEAIVRVIALSIYKTVRDETNSTQEAAFWRTIGYDEDTEKQWENAYPARLEAICTAYRANPDRVYMHLARALAETRLHEMVEQPWNRNSHMLAWMMGELKPVKAAGRSEP